MVTYSSDELISSSEFAKKFGSYLSQIKNKSVEKIAILKNNTIEAVLVSKEEYEQMRSFAEDRELESYKSTKLFKEQQKLFRNIYDGIVSGKERLTPYDEGMSELDNMIDDIENANC